jgi:DNA-binding transcriptional LysR family regulator
LDDVAAFVQVADSRSFTRAGRILERSHKQVSRQVQRLERHLGVTLLHRTTRAVRLSPDGERFYPHAVRLLDEATRAEAALQSDVTIRGTLRVVLPSLSVPVGLAAATRHLRDAHPELGLQITLADHPRDLVAEGHDLQIVAGMPSQTTLRMRRLTTLWFPLVAHADYLAEHGAPEHPDDLARHEALRFLADVPQARWTLAHCDGHEIDVPVGGTLASASSDVLLAWLHEGFGIGTCGAGYLAGPGARRGLARVLPDWTLAPMPLVALRPPTSSSSAAVDAFLDSFLAHVEACL